MVLFSCLDMLRLGHRHGRSCPTGKSIMTARSSKGFDLFYFCILLVYGVHYFFLVITFQMIPLSFLDVIFILFCSHSLISDE